MAADPESPQPFEVDFDITVVDGEPGRRLAVLQADAILEVLTWFHHHAQPSAGQPAAEAAGNGQPAADHGA